MRYILISCFLATSLSAQVSTPHKIALTRVFANPGQVGIFIAGFDGSDEHPLLSSKESDYDPVWAPDGASIVFTSDRMGSADLFLVKPDGTGLQQLTNDPAYDDQAAFAPDGKRLVFVSTRGGGTATL
jgi:TolB protein